MQRLEDYIDFIPHVPGGRQMLHVGPVHTDMRSGNPFHFEMSLLNLEIDTRLHGGIILNVGGHMGYAMAALTNARAIINIDNNALQGVHHSLFGRNVLAAVDEKGQGWESALDSVQAATNGVWRTMFESQALEGDATTINAKGKVWGAYRLEKKTPTLSSFVALLDEPDKHVAGFTNQAMAYCAGLHRAGRIKTVLADLGDQRAMQEVHAYVDDVAASLGAFRVGRRLIPTVAYGTNVVDYMNPHADKHDFCWSANSKQRYNTARWMLQDLTFGLLGGNEGLVISMCAEEGDVRFRRIPHDPNIIRGDWGQIPDEAVPTICPDNPTGPRWHHCLAL